MVEWPDGGHVQVLAKNKVAVSTGGGEHWSMVSEEDGGKRREPEACRDTDTREKQVSKAVNNEVGLDRKG